MYLNVSMDTTPARARTSRELADESSGLRLRPRSAPPAPRDARDRVTVCACDESRGVRAKSKLPRDTVFFGGLKRGSFTYVGCRLKRQADSHRTPT